MDNLEALREEFEKAKEDYFAIKRKRKAIYDDDKERLHAVFVAAEQNYQAAQAAASLDTMSQAASQPAQVGMSLESVAPQAAAVSPAAQLQIPAVPGGPTQTPAAQAQAALVQAGREQTPRDNLARGTAVTDSQSVGTLMQGSRTPPSQTHEQPPPVENVNAEASVRAPAAQNQNRTGEVIAAGPSIISPNAAQPHVNNPQGPLAETQTHATTTEIHVASVHTTAQACLANNQLLNISPDYLPTSRGQVSNLTGGAPGGQNQTTTAQTLTFPSNEGHTKNYLVPMPVPHNRTENLMAVRADSQSVTAETLASPSDEKQADNHLLPNHRVDRTESVKPLPVPDGSQSGTAETRSSPSDEQQANRHLLPVSVTYDRVDTTGNVTTLPDARVPESQRFSPVLLSSEHSGVQTTTTGPSNQSENPFTDAGRTDHSSLHLRSSSHSASGGGSGGHFQNVPSANIRSDIGGAPGISITNDFMSTDHDNSKGQQFPRAERFDQRIDLNSNNLSGNSDSGINTIGREERTTYEYDDAQTIAHPGPKYSTVMSDELLKDRQSLPSNIVLGSYVSESSHYSTENPFAMIDRGNQGAMTNALSDAQPASTAHSLSNSRQTFHFSDYPVTSLQPEELQGGSGHSDNIFHASVDPSELSASRPSTTSSHFDYFSSASSDLNGHQGQVSQQPSSRDMAMYSFAQSTELSPDQQWNVSSMNNSPMTVDETVGPLAMHAEGMEGIHDSTHSQQQGPRTFRSQSAASSTSLSRSQFENVHHFGADAGDYMQLPLSYSEHELTAWSSNTPADPHPQMQIHTRPVSKEITPVTTENAKLRQARKCVTDLEERIAALQASLDRKSEDVKPFEDEFRRGELNWFTFISKTSHLQEAASKIQSNIDTLRPDLERAREELAKMTQHQKDVDRRSALWAELDEMDVMVTTPGRMVAYQIYLQMGERRIAIEDELEGIRKRLQQTSAHFGDAQDKVLRATKKHHAMEEPIPGKLRTLSGAETSKKRTAPASDQEYMSHGHDEIEENDENDEDNGQDEGDETGEITEATDESSEDDPAPQPRPRKRAKPTAATVHRAKKASKGKAVLAAKKASKNKPLSEEVLGPEADNPKYDGRMPLSRLKRLVGKVNAKEDSLKKRRPTTKPKTLVEQAAEIIAATLPLEASPIVGLTASEYDELTVEGRAQMSDFLQSGDINDLKGSVRRLVRKYQDFLPEASYQTRDLALAMHFSQEENYVCRYHTKMRYKKDFDGQGKYTVHGVGYEPDLQGDHREPNHLNCGCPIDDVLLEFWWWKTLTAKSTRPGVEGEEGLKDTLIPPRLRAFFCSAFRTYSNLDIDDVYAWDEATSEKDWWTWCKLRQVRRDVQDLQNRGVDIIVGRRSRLYVPESNGGQANNHQGGHGQQDKGKARERA